MPSLESMVRDYLSGNISYGTIMNAYDCGDIDREVEKQQRSRLNLYSHDSIKWNVSEVKVYVNGVCVEDCNKALGKLRGFANRHTRPQERKEVAEWIELLQSLVDKLEDLKK